MLVGCSPTSTHSLVVGPNSVSSGDLEGSVDNGNLQAFSASIRKSPAGSTGQSGELSMTVVATGGPALQIIGYTVAGSSLVPWHVKLRPGHTLPVVSKPVPSGVSLPIGQAVPVVLEFSGHGPLRLNVPVIAANA